MKLRRLLEQEQHRNRLTSFRLVLPSSRCGLGKVLMGFLVTVAENLPPVTKVMLTSFLSNEQALKFYRGMGFEKDAISPEPRKLRYGKVFNPDYVIMSKEVRGQNGEM